MDKFNVLYYPNSDCSPLTLAKSISGQVVVTMLTHSLASALLVGALEVGIKVMPD